MNSPHPSSGAGRHGWSRLRRLTDAWCETTLSPAEHTELEELLATDERAREKFLEDMCLHAGLEWDVAASTKLDALFEACQLADAAARPSAASAATVRSRRRNVVIQMVIVALAASVLLAAAMLLPGTRRLFTRPDGSLLAKGTVAADLLAERPVVATIAPVSSDSR